MIKRFPLLLGIAAIAACASGIADRRGTVVRDSAGVRIVENTTPLWQEGQAWHLSPEPVVDIGGGDTEDDQLCHVVGAHRTADGRIVIANAGTQELRFFDDQGSFIEAAGGQGEGPGEFRNLRWIQVRGGDSIVAFDNNLRLSLFDARGRFVRSLTLASSPTVRLPVPIIVFPNGAFLAEAARRMRTDPTPSVTRTMADVFLYDADGEFVHPIGSFPANDTWVGWRSDGWLTRTTPLFGRTMQFRRQGLLLVVADNATYQLALYDQAGDLRQLIRRIYVQPSVTRAEIAAALRVRLEGISDPNERRILTRWYENIPEPSTMPAYRGLFVDDLGNCWVHDYSAPTAPDSNARTVFNRDGIMLGAVAFPSKLVPLQIGADFVLGLWRDADDVEHVQLYDLVKPRQ